MLSFTSDVTPSTNPVDHKAPRTLRSATNRVKQEALRRYKEAHKDDVSDGTEQDSGTPLLPAPTFPSAN